MDYARALDPLSAKDVAMAGGIVADLSRTLSHGSTVAREYGLSAVMGTGNAIEHIRDGQVIIVNDAACTVCLGGRR